MRLRILAFSICLMSCAAISIWANDGEWQNIDGPYVIGAIDEIAIGHYDNTRFIFVADSSAQGTLFRTTDNGQSWVRNHFQEGFFHRRVAIEEDNFLNGWTLMVAAGSDLLDEAGPYITADRGVIWVKKDGEGEGHLSTKKLYALSVNEFNGFDWAYVGGEGTQGNNFEKLFLTMNGGEYWQVWQNGIPDDEPGTVYDISSYRFDPHFMYCTYRGPDGRESSGLYRSSHLGEEWEQVEYNIEEFTAIPLAVAIDPQNRDVVYVVESWPNPGDIYMTENAWANDPRDVEFVFIGNYGPCKCIRFDGQGNAYFAFQLTGESQYWAGRHNRHYGFTPLPTNYGFIGDRNGISIAVDPLDDNIVCVGGAYMFYFSDDQGYEFDERVNGATQWGISALGVNGAEICAAGGELLFKFMELAQPPRKWTLRNIAQCAATALEKDWNDHNNVWFCGGVDGERNNDQLFKSMDDGNTWFLTPLYYGQPDPRVDCLLPDTTYGSDSLYFGAGYSAVQYGRFWSSSDNGIENWHAWIVDDGTQVSGISIHPAYPQSILAAERDHGVYRSTNWGHDWSLINNGLTNQYGLRIKYCPNQPNIALLGTEEGVFKSQNVNSGTPSWTDVNNGCLAGYVQDIEFHPTDNSIVCLSIRDGEAGRVYLSADTARSWVEVGAGLNGSLAHDVTTDPNNPDTFYVATDDGVYKLKNPVKCGTLPSIPTAQTWGPGTIIVNGDVTVPVGVTLNIAPGTRIQVVYDFDKLEGGSAPEICEIIVEGTLNAEGTPDDSILFVASSEQLGAAQPGDWYGIRFMPGSSGSFDYCAIRHAINGIEIDNDPRVTVNHSLLKSCEIAGINSYKGYLDVLNSRIDDNKIYGIYSYMSVDSIYNTWLVDNEQYAIYIDAPMASGDSSYVLYDSIACPNPPPGSNQAGIKIYNHDWVRLYKSKVINYENAVICYNSDVVIRNCDLGGGGEVGVYSQQLSRPSIRTSYLGSNTIGVKTTTYASANIGKGSSDYGNCSFSYCTSWYIYHYAIPPHVPWLDTLWAQNNYYGGPPDPGKFRHDNANVIVYFPALRNPPPNPRLDPNQEIPQAFSLGQNFPNPFNPQTTIRFSLDAPAFTTVMIYNILGQQVRRLVSEEMDAGEHAVVWSGRDEGGSPVSSGIYFYTIQAGEHFESKKMVMVR